MKEQGGEEGGASIIARDTRDIEDTDELLVQLKKEIVNDDETSTTTTDPGDRNDPDYGYFPFWLGSFVFFGQMFIYGVVIVDLLSNKEIPPNVDRWLRLAEVCLCLIISAHLLSFIHSIDS